MLHSIPSGRKQKKIPAALKVSLSLISALDARRTVNKFSVHYHARITYQSAQIYYLGIQTFRSLFPLVTKIMCMFELGSTLSTSSHLLSRLHSSNGNKGYLFNTFLCQPGSKKLPLISILLMKYIQSDVWTFF